MTTFLYSMCGTTEALQRQLHVREILGYIKIRKPNCWARPVGHYTAKTTSKANYRKLIP